MSDKYSFLVDGTNLSCLECTEVPTGNAGTLYCEFKFASNAGLKHWFCSFRKAGKVRNVEIVNGTCEFADEMLAKEGKLFIGAFGTNLENGASFKRISTNFVKIDVGRGAYQDAVGKVTPSLWEQCMEKVEECKSGMVGNEAAIKAISEGLNNHQNARPVDHPDGSITRNKLAFDVQNLMFKGEINPPSTADELANSSVQGIYLVSDDYNVGPEDGTGVSGSGLLIVQARENFDGSDFLLEGMVQTRLKSNGVVIARQSKTITNNSVVEWNEWTEPYLSTDKDYVVNKIKEYGIKGVIDITDDHSALDYIYGKEEEEFGCYLIVEELTDSDDVLTPSSSFLIVSSEIDEDGSAYPYQLWIKANGALIYRKLENTDSSELKWSDWSRRYVTSTDYATKDVAGVVKVVSGQNSYGITLDDNKRLKVSCAEKKDIVAKASYNNPITPVYLEYAVEVCTNQDREAELTEAQMKLPPSTKYLEDVAFELSMEIGDLQNASLNGDDKLSALENATAINCEVSGNSISVNDSAEMPLKGLSIYGKTELVKPTCKNLFHFSTNGYDLTNGDGGIFLSFNTDESVCYVFGEATLTHAIATNSSFTLAAGTYTLSVSGLNTITSTEDRIYLINSDTSAVIRNDVTSANARSFTISEDTNVGIVFVFASGSSYPSSTDVKIQLEEGPTATGYASYISGEVPLSPEYPHALNSVGMSENLLNYTVSSQTISGVTFTVNEDKSITANGTATADVYFHLESVYVESGKTYFCSGCPTSGGSGKHWLAFQKRVDGTGVGSLIDYGSGTSIAADGSFDNIRVVICVKSGATVSNATFYPMVTLGTTQKPYEPYGGGSMQVDVLSKNVFDTAKFIELVKTYDTTAEEMVVDGRNCIKFDIFRLYKKDFSEVVTFNPNNTYTWSMDIKFHEKYSSTSTSDCYLGMGFLYNDELGVQTNIGNTISGVPLVNRRLNNSMYGFAEFGKVSITSASGVPFNGIAFVYNDRGYWLIDLDSIQLEEGSVVTYYEPYTIQSLTLSTPNGLPGVPVSSEGNYTDSSGQQWVCDEIDLARGVYIQRCVEYIFNSSDVDMLHSGNGVWQYCTIPASALPCTLKDSAYGLWEMGSYYLYSGMDSFAVDTFYYVDFESISETSNGVVDLFFNLDYNRPLSDYDGSKLLLVRETPVEIPLSEAEIEAYKSLQTHKPVTHIFNDEGAHMAVKYIADTKNYIDNKIAELQTALLNATT